MAYSQLRELARSYAAGQVSRGEYRSRRAALLADFASGKLQIDYRDIVAPKPATPPTVIIDVGDDEPEVRRAPIILGAIALVAAIGAAGYWYLRLQTAGPAPVVAVQPRSPAVTVVERFLTQGDYSAVAVAAFVQEWQGFDPALQAEARTDASWKRLRFALRARVRDQQELVPVDATGNAAAEEARLREFATALGMKIN